LQESATILVIDDNEANLALARDILEDEGYRVVVARGGAEGISSFEARRPDCVLLDVRMPEVDGFAVCERIRALPGGADVPIVFFTAQRDIDTFDRAMHAGGDDFVTKPVRPTELILRVQTNVRLRQARDELHEHYALSKAEREHHLRTQLQKERLMAFIVHDLKNPVNSMDLHAQVLLRGGRLTEGDRDSVTQIRAEAKQLARMILNLLDVSKAEEGKLSPKYEEVDFAAVARSVLGELELHARVRNVKLDTALEVSAVWADEDLLRRALANLVENAVRHAPAGSAVRVTAKAGPEGETEIRVLDQGPGVPEGMRTKVFEAFMQTEGSASREGRGLGLTFCKLAVEAHGGRIWVEDGAPGAVFCIRFPGQGRAR